MCFNPVSALTRATMAEICALPDTRALARRMMEEGEAVAAALGVRLRVTIDRRLDGAARVGHHKTSMLQDVENDRRTEIEALVGTVAELGKMTGVQTPTTEAVYALTRLLDRSGIAP
jgi:2-dehydropantoate 2-reductase